MPDTTTPGFRTFVIVWFGQLVSLIGTALTGFALALFVYTETGSATQLSLVLLASQLPQIVFTPIAGALVDRWDRRVAMIVSDTGVSGSGSSRNQHRRVTPPGGLAPDVRLPARPPRNPR